MIEAIRASAVRLVSEKKLSVNRQATLMNDYIGRCGRDGAPVAASHVSHQVWNQFAKATSKHIPNNRDVLKVAWDWMSSEHPSVLLYEYNTRSSNPDSIVEGPSDKSAITLSLERSSASTVEEWWSRNRGIKRDGRNSFFIVSRYLYDYSMVSISEAMLAQGSNGIQVYVRWPHLNLNNRHDLHESFGELACFSKRSLIVGVEDLQKALFVIYIDGAVGASFAMEYKGTIVRKLDSLQTIWLPCCLESQMAPWGLGLFKIEDFTKGEKSTFAIKKMLSKEPMII